MKYPHFTVSSHFLLIFCHEAKKPKLQCLWQGLAKVPIEKFVIHKGLTKDPKDYADKKNQPHVQVALRMKAAGKSVKALDTIPYVVCLDGTTNGSTSCCHHCVLFDCGNLGAV